MLAVRNIDIVVLAGRHSDVWSFISESVCWRGERYELMSLLVGTAQHTFFCVYSTGPPAQLLRHPDWNQLLGTDRLHCSRARVSNQRRLSYVGAGRKTKYLNSNIFHFSPVCFCSQPRTHPVMACLLMAQGLRMWQPSLLLPHPQKSASWSCHPRCRLIQAPRLCASWRSGPACHPCPRCRRAQPWMTSTRAEGL